MKKISMLLAVVIFFQQGFAQPRIGRRIPLSPGRDGGLNIRWPQVGRYHPGDTLVLNSSKTWNYFYLDNYKGSPLKPLVITNDKTDVVKFSGPGGIQVTNSTDIRITGTGSRNKYGFFIEGDPVYRLAAGMALLVHMRSKNVEMDHISVHNMGFGLVCRTDNYCVDSLTYPNWVLDSISVHDCKMIGLWYEGMYIGNTSPDNARDSYDPRPIVCNGDTVYPMPMRNGHGKVYNNLVDSTGRGGIQLASASAGLSEIYNNTVRHSGMNGDTDQGTGISVGTYTHVYIHDNIVCNTFTVGISSIGGSGTGSPLRIERNKIDSSGFLIHYDLVTTEETKIDPGSQRVFADTLTWPCSIQLVTRSTKFTDSTLFWIIGNRVGKNKSSRAQIQVHDDYRTMQYSGNKLCANTNQDGGDATWFVDPAKGKFEYQINCTFSGQPVHKE